MATLKKSQASFRRKAQDGKTLTPKGGHSVHSKAQDAGPDVEREMNSNDKGMASNYQDLRRKWSTPLAKVSNKEPSEADLKAARPAAFRKAFAAARAEAEKKRQCIRRNF
jgi:hypothetical protein